MKKIITVAILIFAGIAAIIVRRDFVAHGANLVPVNLAPTTTLTAQTSNNTSAYSGFPAWPDGDEAPGNVSKVNMHTLLYPGSNSNIFAVIEPWFCVNSPGAVSESPGCNGHDEIGYNQNSSAQVTAQVSDMISRGINGATCDFYGVGYDSRSTSEQKTCDLFGQVARTESNFSFMMMEDDGSWKWRCDGSANPPGWQTLGYPSLESCIQSLLENDLSYFNAAYYPNPAYYTVNGRPVVAYFVTEDNPMTSLGSSGWATLWGNIRTWARSNGNPLFVFESAANSGSEFWDYSDGAYGWPQPDSSTTDWQGNGYLPWFYNTLSADTLAVEQGTTYKGFNDTLASWGSDRITDQQCGTTWLDTWNEPTINNDFGPNRQMQGVLVATWNDYEEGTEIETGIDNCLSISSSLSGSELAWNITGSAATLDHYTVYISTDGQDLAVLADNISPSVTSLDLSQYAIPSGSYTLYVQAVGKPSVLNHMSNSVAYSVGGGSCTEATFNGGTVSVVTTTPGGSYAITCNYGFVGPGIAPNVGSGECTYKNFDGTAAVFNCTAGAATGTFSNACAVGSWNTGNYCLETNPIASLTVVAPQSTSTPPVPPLSIAITSPTDGEAVAGTITVAGQTSDSATTTASVQVSVDGGAYVLAVGTAPWSYQLSTASLANGAHTLMAEAFDPLGNVGTTSVAFDVQNQAASSSGSSGGGGGGGGPFDTSNPLGGTSSSSSSDEALLQSLLAELQSLINQLNTQLVASFMRNLTIGSYGTEVQSLQIFLNDNGYPIAPSGAGSPGDESEYFGGKTAASLAKFQAAHNLPATGYFGSLTRLLLRSKW